MCVALLWKASNTHWIGHWLDPGDSMEKVAKRKVLISASNQNIILQSHFT